MFNFNVHLILILKLKFYFNKKNLMSNYILHFALDFVSRASLTKFMFQHPLLCFDRMLERVGLRFENSCFGKRIEDMCWDLGGFTQAIELYSIYICIIIFFWTGK